MEHIAIDAEKNCKVLDFRAALVAKWREPRTSEPIVGRLPCIAPQVALSQPYIPRMADAWSLGVVLLETAGGLNALSQSVPYSTEAPNLSQVANRIVAHFSTEGSHEKSLTALGGPPEPEILQILRALLVVEEGDRTDLRDLYSTRHPHQAEP
eukprot:SRR837773.24434.p1 GENE.SRR837773.24434~~SRR837773.24434.p1  ORF type:complete len:164 (-),score=33.27 SRR837773.24434:38-496(-)